MGTRAGPHSTRHVCATAAAPCSTTNTVKAAQELVQAEFLSPRYVHAMCATKVTRKFTANGKRGSGGGGDGVGAGGRGEGEGEGD
jgi:hypothetical protein